MFSILWLCVSSDPQSSRARKLCVTMEPALLLKGDILVGNFPYTPHCCNTSIIYFHTITATNHLWLSIGIIFLSLSACLYKKKPT